MIRLFIPLLVFSLYAIPSSAAGYDEWNERVAPFRKEMPVEDCRLHYIDTGRGRPLLMVHGFADSSFTWFRNAGPLAAAGYRCIIVDQPGMGRSSTPPKGYRYAVENQARRILTLMDRLGIKTFHLAGHSMGGGLSLYLVSNHSERITRAVLIDPLCYPPKKITFTALPGAEYAARLFAGRWTFRAALKGVYYDDRLVTDALVDEYARFMARADYFTVICSLSRDFVSDAFLGMTRRYPEITVPLLILWGDHDTWLKPDFGRRLHGAVPKSKFRLIKDAGHNPHQEKYAEVNVLIVDFFSR